MAKVMDTFTVQDFESFKVGYDSGADMRRAAGWISTEVFRHEQNPNDLVLIQDWDNLENFKTFSNLPQLKEIQKRANVTNVAGYILEEASN